MSRVNPDELPANMAVLGLLIERPESTVKEIGQEVRKRFRRARFAASIAHGAVPRLAERQGSRRPCAELAYKADRDTQTSQDRYRPTQYGLRVFRAWMYDELEEDAQTIGNPSLREAMLGRIELAQAKDLPRLIQMVRLEARVSADMFAGASQKLREHLAERVDPLDIDRKIRGVLLYADPSHWSARSARYRDIAERLEDIKTEAEAAGVEMLGA
jgi:hypothetical protein